MNQFNALYSESFSDRHIGPRQSDLNAMLATIGAASLDELIDQVVPSNIRLPKPLSVKKRRRTRPIRISSGWVITTRTHPV